MNFTVYKEKKKKMPQPACWRVLGMKADREKSEFRVRNV